MASSLFLRCSRFARKVSSIQGEPQACNTRLKATAAKANLDVASAPTRPEIGQANTLIDIGTRAIWTEDHDMFRETCRKFFVDHVMPYHDKFEEQGHCSREMWEEAGKQGLLGVTTPEEHGGIGADLLYTAVTWEEQQYANCSGPGFILHSDIVMPYISKFGTQEQIEKYLPDMAAGRKIGAIAMTEPSAGSDLQGVKTHAKKDGDDYIMNGSKTFITNGYLSDVVIVVAVTDPEAKSPAHGISLFLLDAGTPGFNKGRILKKMGLRAQDTSELFFEDVRLPKSQLLGKENQGFYMLMQELPRERILIADMAQAHSEWMFEETRNYVRQRKAFKRTIADLQTVKHKLAELKTEICVGRGFMDQCLRLWSEGKLDTATASMAKYWCSDLQNKVANDCVQLHGGWGYMWEYPICKAYVDSRVQPIYGGSNEIMKELIARPITASM